MSTESIRNDPEPVILAEPDIIAEPKDSFQENDPLPVQKKPKFQDTKKVSNNSRSNDIAGEPSSQEVAEKPKIRKKSNMLCWCIKRKSKKTKRKSYEEKYCSTETGQEELYKKGYNHDDEVTKRVQEKCPDKGEQLIKKHVRESLEKAVLDGIRRRR